MGKKLHVQSKILSLRKNLKLKKNLAVLQVTKNSNSRTHTIVVLQGQLDKGRTKKVQYIFWVDVVSIQDPFGNNPSGTH